MVCSTRPVAEARVLTVSDLGVEAQIHPDTWGRMSFQSKF